MNHMTWPCIDGRLCITWYDYVWWIIWHDHPSKVGYVYYIMTWPGGGGFRLDITWHATNHHMHSSLVLNMHSTLLLYIYQLYIHQSINYLLIYISVFRLISFSYISVFRLISFSPGDAVITFSNLSNSGGELSAVSKSIIGDLALNLTSSPFFTRYRPIDLLFTTPHLQGDNSRHGHDCNRKNLIYIINLLHHNN